MIDIEKYIFRLIDSLKHQFGSRLLYVGLQGSYLRGEATSKSDIDIMVVIENLGVTDLKHYRTLLQSMEHFDKSCGFICSKGDLAGWNPLEIQNLLNSTEDHYGKLIDLVPSYTEQDTRNFIKMSINNLYHEICHRFIHAECNSSIEALARSYKNVFFILQNLYFLQTGVNIKTKAELLPRLTEKHHAVLKRSMELTSGVGHDFEDSFELLFSWCQENLASL